MRNRPHILLGLAAALAVLFVAPLYAQNDRPVINIPRTPQDPVRLKEQLAMKYYTSREFEKAATVYEELYENYPRHYYYTYLLNCYIYLSELKKADRLVKTQLRAQPGNYRYLVDQIFVYEQSGNSRRAEKLAGQLLEELPDNRSLILQIATAFESRGYYAMALEVYNKAQMLPGTQNNFQLEKARVYQYTGEYDMMFDAYLEHLDLYPQDMQTIKNRMQSLMRQDVDDNLSSILKGKLLEKAQANPGNQVYAEMLLWHVMQTKDYEMAFRQARAIDMRFENREEAMLELAEICFANEDYAMAAKAYGYLKDKKTDSPLRMEAVVGYYISSVKLADADLSTDLRTYRNLAKEGGKLLEDMEISAGTVGIVKNLAHIDAFRLGEYQKASGLLEEALSIGNISPLDRADLKLELADILLFLNKVWDATLLYSQVEQDLKNEPIGHEAKFRNARLFYYIGEYNWALAKLDILKSATSKLIANDALELSLLIKDLGSEDTTGQVVQQFGQADLLAYRDQYDSARIVLDGIAGTHNGFYTYQHLIYKKAQLREAMGDFKTADSLYATLVANYPGSIKADNALFRRAEIYSTVFGDEPKAMDLYMTLMREYPDSIYAGESRKRYRTLRRDDDIIN